jgi:glycosyltransferase involved in cell wall biosynthesis
MPEHLPDRPDLLIVSDTAMWELDKEVIAFEPVVREIENFDGLFSSITWIGYRYDNAGIWKNARPVNGVDVKFILLPKVGGEKLADKLKIIWKAPLYFLVVLKQVLKHRVIHSRGPSLPAFFAIIISLFGGKRIYWHKYAGNWEGSSPFFYRLQKNLLKLARRSKVTINGEWPGTPPHILNFENPCLTGEEIESARLKASQKNFDGKLTLCFVGNLNVNKGIIQLVEALKEMDGKYFGEVVIAGDGPEKARLEEALKEIKIEVKLAGFQSREQLNEIYARSHFIMLPSASEGFPKVIAEAMAFGCIPVVTDMSCIGQYIIDGNTGFLLPDNSKSTIITKTEQIFAMRDRFSTISSRAAEMSNQFTYSRYNKHIKESILHDI